MSDEKTSQARWRLSRAAETALAATRGPQRPLQHLANVQRVLEMVRAAEVDLIESAHSEGFSWAQIAAVRGTTRQAERQAHLRREADLARPAIDRWLERMTTRRPVIGQQTIPARTHRERDEDPTGNPLRGAPNAGEFPTVAG